MKKLKGAVIGLGYWGPNIVRNFLKIPDVELVSICDISKKSIENAKLSFPPMEMTTDPDKIFAKDEIDFVSIATPVSTHFELAFKALDSGKHVLLEKPMTLSSSEAKKLIKKAEIKNKILMVGHTFLYADSIQKIKKMIENKNFGEVLYFDSTRVNLGKFQSDVNVVWDLAPHDFSILQYLFGSPQSIHVLGSSHISKKKLEIAHIYLKYTNNFICHIHVSWLSPLKIRSILIGGTKKMISYDDIAPSEKIKLYEKSVSINKSEVTPFSPAYRSGNVIIPHLSQKEALLTELEHFVYCIKKNKKPLSSGEDGLEVVKMLEACDKSLVMKKEVSYV